MATRPTNGRPVPWLRPVVDAAMAVAYLLQMVPGRLGNPLHEVAGLAFVVLFVAHHVLNRGWLRRLGHARGPRTRLLLVSDVALTVSVVGVATTGVLMSRSVAPWIAVPAVAHVVRPLHGCCAYLGLMLVALHVGLHVRVMRGYAGRRGGVVSSPVRDVILLAVALALGIWAFVRLGVAGKLAGASSFPDGMTPLVVQLAWHLALTAPFVASGALVDDRLRGNAGTSPAA